MTVISRQQALARGRSPAQIRHLLARGTWQRLLPGVYLTHTGRPSWRERLQAALLRRGDGAVVTLECALRLWGLTDREPGILTLGEPATTHRRRAVPGVRVRRRRRLTRAMRYGIPVTEAAQTVIDVLATPGRTPDDDMALITRAVSRRTVTVDELRAELRHHPRHPRRESLGEILAAAAQGLGSAAEVRYVERVERAHGLPWMERQVPMDGAIAVADGRSRVLDLRDRERGIGLEIDGDLWHRDKQLRDRGRDRQVAGRGGVTLRAGWVEVVERPCELAVDVALTQIARGWTGRPVPCGPGCAVSRDARLRAAAS